MKLLALLREGYVATPNGSQTAYVQDEQTLRDALDLFAVVKQDYEATGSPNLENAIVAGMVNSLQSSQSLSGAQVGQLLKLLQKYRTEIDAFRARGRDGQDALDVPDPDTGRLVHT